MNLFFDTSALIKRYIFEVGSDKVDELFETADSIIVSHITKLESYSTIKRLLKTGMISETDYNKLKGNMKMDFKHFTIIAFDKMLEEKAIELIEKYQLKTLDSIQLASCLNGMGDIDYFVVSDKKLKNASQQELIELIDPTE